MTSHSPYMISWKSAFGICFIKGFGDWDFGRDRWDFGRDRRPPYRQKCTQDQAFHTTFATQLRRRRADIAPTFSRRGVLPRRSAGVPRAESAAAPAGIRPGSSISHAVAAACCAAAAACYAAAAACYAAAAASCAAAAACCAAAAACQAAAAACHTADAACHAAEAVCRRGGLSHGGCDGGEGQYGA